MILAFLVALAILALLCTPFALMGASSTAQPIFSNEDPFNASEIYAAGTVAAPTITNISTTGTVTPGRMFYTRIGQQVRLAFAFAYTHGATSITSFDFALPAGCTIASDSDLAGFAVMLTTLSSATSIGATLAYQSATTVRVTLPVAVTIDGNGYLECVLRMTGSDIG